MISVADDEQPAIEGALSTEEHFVNGKGCEPRTAKATLTVDAGGGLAIAHP